MKNLILACALLICLGGGLRAQTDSNIKAADNLPIWVQMMNDENVNYFDAVKAFETYLKNHPMPGEDVEEELMGEDNAAKERYEKEMKEENKEISTEQQRKELIEREQLRYQMKRFRNWMKEMKPYVQEDGRILTNAERILIWQKQQEEMKQVSPNKK